MKMKNYKWHGFGFPVIFSELPAMKVQGEWIPDVDFLRFARPVIEFICRDQELPLSGNQVKFIRHHLDMNLREFGQFMGVTHQSVMRWEKQGAGMARMEAHVELICRLKILKTLKTNTKAIERVLLRLENIDTFKSLTYKQIRPVEMRA